MKNAIQNASETNNGYFLLEYPKNFSSDFEFYRSVEMIDDGNIKAKTLLEIKEAAKKNMWFFFRDLIIVPNEFNQQKDDDLSLCMREYGNFILSHKAFHVLYLYQKGFNIIIDQKFPGSEMLCLLICLYEEYIHGEIPAGLVKKERYFKTVRRVNNHLINDAVYYLDDVSNYTPEKFAYHIRESKKHYLTTGEPFNIERLCEILNKTKNHYEQIIIDCSKDVGIRNRLVDSEAYKYVTKDMFKFRGFDLVPFLSFVDSMSQKVVSGKFVIIS